MYVHGYLCNFVCIAIHIYTVAIFSCIYTAILSYTAIYSASHKTL